MINDLPMANLISIVRSCIIHVNKEPTINRISTSPNVCHGKPVIRNTRVLVANILGALGSGQSIDEVLEDYPNISKDDVYAVLNFASELSQFEELPIESAAHELLFNDRFQNICQIQLSPVPSHPSINIL